jgi:hypothetical protein
VKKTDLLLPEVGPRVAVKEKMAIAFNPSAPYYRLLL